MFNVRNFLGMCLLTGVFIACSFGWSFAGNAPMDGEVNKPKTEVKKPVIYGLYCSNNVKGN